MKFHYRQSDRDGQYYWSIVARNGKTVADGAEGYTDERGVLKAIEKLNSKFIKPLRIVLVLD